jgi:hypothetical protein
MQKRASRTNPKDAKLAEMQERTQARLKESTSPQFAQNAARNAKFLSNPPKANLYTAAIASQK